MYTRDYIMRMIEQLIQVIELVLFHKRRHEYPEALAEINLGGTRLLGMEWTFFVTLSDAAMIETIRRRAEIDHRVYEIAGDLLREESEILLLQGKEEEAWRRMVSGFSLYCESLMKQETELLREKALQSLQLIDEYELPPSVRSKRDWLTGSRS
jgi:hypothetical protein